MANVKTLAMNKNQMLAFVNSFLAYLQNLCNQDNNPTVHDLEKHFSKNFQLSSNGKILTRSINDYPARLNHLRQKYSHFDIVGPLEEPLIADNAFTVHYELDLQGRDRQSHQVYIMATATIEDNKIAQWIQVTHEKGTGLWDA
jgi:hypothetical protein